MFWVKKKKNLYDNFVKGHGQKCPLIFKMAPSFGKHGPFLQCKEIGDNVYTWEFFSRWPLPFLSQHPAVYPSFTK